MNNNCNKIQKFVAEIIYLFLIFFFCYTSSNKLINIDSFRINLIKTSIFSSEIAYYFSYVVILFEFIVVFLLIFLKQKGLIAFCLIMVTFTIYISFLKYNGLYEICGCGGILNGLDYRSHLIINISLILGSLFLINFQNLNFEK